MAIFASCKRYLIAGIGIAGALAIGTLYVLLRIVGARAKTAEQTAAQAQADVAVQTASAKTAAQTQTAAQAAVAQVEAQAAAEPAPDTEGRTDFEGTQ